MLGSAIFGGVAGDTRGWSLAHGAGAEGAFNAAGILGLN